MLAEPSIATFGRRRKALQREYVELLKAWGTASAAVLTFPTGGKLLLRWIQEEKCLYIESDTGRYGETFHKLALDAIAYMGKNLGAKMLITDRSGYALSDLLRYTPYGWYTVILAAVAIVLGLTMLCSKNVCTSVWSFILRGKSLRKDDGGAINYGKANGRRSNGLLWSFG